MDDYDPYLDAFTNINEEEEEKQTNSINLNIKNNSNMNPAPEYSTNPKNEKNPIINNNMELDEKEENKKFNNLLEETNKEQQDRNTNEKINQSPNSLLGKKLKQSDELVDAFHISSINNNNNANNNINNEPIKEYTSINNNSVNKNVEEYDYGYSIILLNEGETGLMDDFFKEKQNESTTSDYFNFHLDEDKWIKILNHSILLHYERHIKEEIEKRKKFQAYMNNINNMSNNNGTGNTQMMAPMNPMMFINMGNGVNYQQMYLQNLNNLKNMQYPYNFTK